LILPDRSLSCCSFPDLAATRPEKSYALTFSNHKGTIMVDLKEQWDLEMALAVLENKTVDSKLWAEAVEWLLLYGPPQIKELVSQASGMATQEYFPELKANSYTPDGQPCYDVQAIAEALGLSKEEVMKKIAKMEEKRDVIHLYEESETEKIQ